MVAQEERGRRVAAVQRVRVDEEGRLVRLDQRRVLQRAHAPVRLLPVEVLLDERVEGPEEAVIDEDLGNERRDEPGDRRARAGEADVAPAHRADRPDQDEGGDDHDVRGANGDAGGGEEEGEEDLDPRGAPSLASWRLPREGDAREDQHGGQQVAQRLRGVKEQDRIEGAGDVGQGAQPRGVEDGGELAADVRAGRQVSGELDAEDEEAQLLLRHGAKARHGREKERVPVRADVGRPGEQPLRADDLGEVAVAPGVVDEGRVGLGEPVARDGDGRERGAEDDAPVSHAACSPGPRKRSSR